MGGWTALMWASYKGHSNIALQLLGSGSDPNTQGQHHMSSLVWAAGRGHTEIVQGLIQHKAKVNIGDKFGTTPLIWACRKGYYDIAEALLKSGADVDASGMYSWTPLLVATRGNYADLVHLILDYKPHLNSVDKDGGTALTIACKEGYTEIAVALLNAGAYVNMQDRNGDSNLIYAARGGHRAVVEALMKKYADVEIMGRERKNALYWSIEKGHTSVVKILLSANPDLESTTKDGDTCLLRSVRTKNAEVVQMLVDKKARVSVADKKGDTALHIAMRGRSKRIVEILLRNPKNSQMLYRPNRAGETPYNMDLSNQKTIMGQIFGARRLNTNEDNENMLGYDLYSSAMADILSEPSLSMPISVGLYAKWGSGKSFLIKKLREEMSSFAKQWVEPLFQFSPLVFLLVVHLTVVAGLITAVPTLNWHIGLASASAVFLLCTVFLIAVWYGARRYDWPMWFKWSVSLERQMASLKLVLQVIFCSPPGPNFKDWKDGVQARPLKFIFADGAKPSSTAAGENAVVQMIGSLFDMVEREYGVFSTRFYRAFRPRAHSSSSPWRYRRLCCMPYIVIFFVTLICTLTAAVLASLFGFSSIYPEGPPVEKSELTRLARATGFDLGNNDDGEDDDISNEVMGDDLSAEDDDDSENDNKGFHDLLPYHRAVMMPLLITLGVLVAIVIVANLSTLARMFSALIFSHRRHLLRSVAKLDTLKAEGYLHTLKGEVNLMIEMVKCLDAFTSQQTRLVVVVDGLDSCEQEKVLSVLDAVHMLFTDSNAPFIILLAIDPHIITKAIELHVHRVFNESSISGHDYLRNIVHLPFYLQNSGLRKVKLAQQAADRHKGKSQSMWTEVETDIASTSALSNRKASSDGVLSASQMLRRNKSTKSLRPNDSIASSIASNLNRVGGAQDLTKVLLTDDYFSDINPRSMRRLMNVVYITGRLLKAFHIDFNWYHLASWINITEQWPYRASWLILYFEANGDHIEDKISLKELYEKVRGKIPNSKEMEPLLELDKDEKKFDIFLSMHKSSLHIMDLTIFLPFTINLDPYIRKVIKEGQSNFDGGLIFNNSPAAGHWPYSPLEQNANHAPPPQLTRRISHLNQMRAKKESTNSLPAMNPMMWGYGAPPYGLPYGPPSIASAPSLSYMPHNFSNTSKLPAEAFDKKLSELSIEDLFDLLSKLDGISTSLPSYKDRLIENNINGKVLLHCDLDDLKKVVGMNFGDWELFRVLICSLREKEMEDEFNTKNMQFQNPSLYESNEEDQVDSGAVNSGSTALDSAAHSKRSTPSQRSEESYSSSRKPSKQQNLIAKQNFSPRRSPIAKKRSIEKHFNRKFPIDADDDDDDDDTAALLPNEEMSSDLNVPKIVVEQVTMEEQLIFGALQTLNEEACEDVLDEQVLAAPGTPKQISDPDYGCDESQKLLAMEGPPQEITPHSYSASRSSHLKHT
ncbi:unnamed protein product [Meganyctiphanes norvegica]|uniref:KAP NTPase domain-containing protein n=1 Tax=Meganyctiphanes norvegica TaxID=48144 RepID=A0AAV2Q3T2_MEGNR